MYKFQDWKIKLEKLELPMFELGGAKQDDFWRASATKIDEYHPRRLVKRAIR
jgi:hypothetical protein